MRIGIFGGSFDPVHRGHEHLVKELVDKLFLDKVLVIPVFVSPFKVQSPPKASGKDRIAMLELAFEGNPRVVIGKEEVERKGVSYTVDTVRALIKQSPKEEYFLLLTKEAIETFSLWKESEALKKMVHVVFASSKKEVTDQGDVIEIPWISMSSTEIRKQLQTRSECKNFLTPKVLDYIEKHQLYLL